MTSPERRALLFLSAVALAGGGVRLAREWGAPPPPGDTRQALARQIEAVDSAKRASAHKEGGGRRSPRGPTKSSARRKGSPDLGLIAPRSGESSGQTPAHSSLVPRPSSPGSPSSLVPRPSPQGSPSSLIDVDNATAAELERLPRIGPALAARITRDRDSLGPFGSLDALQRVKGIGPALAAAIAARVTFSGVPRPVNAVLGPASGADPSAARTPRRRKKS